MFLLDSNAPYIKKISKKVSEQNKNIEQLVTTIQKRLENLTKFHDPISVEEIPHFSILSLIIEMFITPMYLITERWVKKRFYANENCTHCGICQRICPSGNITVTQDDVSFDNKCYLCLRCIHQCPEKAIQIGKITNGKYRYKGPDRKYNPLKLMNYL